jgi:hypothetical protein
MNSELLYLVETIERIVSFAWEHGSSVIALFAAWATWLAAKQAARSADIARSSMLASAQAAHETLEETRNFNRRSSFENRYAMLLDQHNIYHQQVCDYIEREQNNGKSGGVNSFFDSARSTGKLEESLAFLTGHTVISRYMRTLYHLLKFVSDEFYTSDDALRKMKGYVSPLRSAIRNGNPPEKPVC